MAKNPISEEEKALFRQAVHDVKPLPKKRKPLTQQVSIKKQSGDVLQTDLTLLRPASAESLVKSAVVNKIIVPDLYLSNYYTNEVQADSILSFCRKECATKRFNDLKAGKIAWQDRLDLHGFTSNTAEVTFKEFILRVCRLQYRCVLLIHGKGSLRHEAPIIKNLVNNWLPQINEVLAFHSAQPKHGGNGAVYVLLKRAKNNDLTLL